MTEAYVSHTQYMVENRGLVKQFCYPLSSSLCTALSDFYAVVFDNSSQVENPNNTNVVLSPLYQTTKPTRMTSHAIFINSSTDSRLYIYVTSSLGGPQTLLGSYLRPAAELVQTVDVCLPAGEHHVAFVANGERGVVGIGPITFTELECTVKPTTARDGKISLDAQ